MCCFSGEIEKVWDTRIFARRVPGRQFLVYQMQLSTADETAMVLPVPVERNGGEKDLKFIDLSGYPEFFKDMESCFPYLGPVAAAAGEAMLSGDLGLEVHDVGAYEASYVPTLADFKRLDARFRLPEQLWKTIPTYSDYGFAVFRIKPGKDLEFHPMAFQFPVAGETPLYFPTVHVHDGTMASWADFDHVLYAQGFMKPNSDWRWSREIIGKHVDEIRARGVVAPNETAWRREMTGTYENRDTLISFSA